MGHLIQPRDGRAQLPPEGATRCCNQRFAGLFGLRGQDSGLETRVRGKSSELRAQGLKLTILS